MTQVTVYTQNDCPPCAFIKNYFNTHGVVFTEKNIQNTTYRNEMIDYDAFSTPFFIINDTPMYQIDMDQINAQLNITN